jgi:hypothetical protein
LNAFAERFVLRVAARTGAVARRERLGGLLNFYLREEE